MKKIRRFYQEWSFRVALLHYFLRFGLGFVFGFLVLGSEIWGLSSSLHLHAYLCAFLPPRFFQRADNCPPNPTTFKKIARFAARKRNMFGHSKI